MIKAVFESLVIGMLAIAALVCLVAGFAVMFLVAGASRSDAVGGGIVSIALLFAAVAIGFVIRLARRA